MKQYEKLVFTYPEKEKEWANLPQADRDFITKHLSENASKMENRVAIEMLCHVVNDLISRIEKLEKNAIHLLNASMRRP